MKKTLTVFLILLPAMLWSQSVDFKKQNFPSDEKGFEKALTSYNRGFDYFERGPRYFEQSLRYLLEANEFNPNNSDLNYVIGTVYNALNLKGEAAEYFKKAAQLNPKFRKEGQRLTAENLQLDMQWDRAISEYKEYLEILNQESAKANKNEKAALDAETADIQRKIKECENGKTVAKDTVSIVIINLGKGVNSKYPDYSAVVTADEKNMYFTSRRANTTGGGIPPGDVFYYEDIYHSEKGSDGRWGPARNVKGLINTNDHEGTIALTPDGKKMIIYRPKNSGDLYEATLGEDGAWGIPKPLEGINSKYRETHASYTPDGKTIYFTSDNPTYGAKGLDIFKSVYDEATKKWSAPERLPETVNSDFDEDGVFLDSEGKFMYFSSKGRNSIGGYDVFKSELVNGTPTEAVNMGYPVNSPADEIFFVVMPGGTRAYFNSARKGGFGEKDIYTMLLLSDLKLNLYGTLYDNTDQKIVKDAKIELTRNNEALEVTVPTPGDYAAEVRASQKYKAVVKADGYEDLIEYFTADMVHPDSLSIRKDFFLTPSSHLIVMGKVFDEETEKAIPAKLEFETIMGESKVDAKSTEAGYSAKLNRSGVYKVKVTADGYIPYEDMLSLNEAGKSAELEKNFYLSKVGSKGIVKDITLNGFIIEKATGTNKNGIITIKDDKNKVVTTLTVTAAQGYSVKLKSSTPYSFTVESEGFATIEERVSVRVPKNVDVASKNFYVEKPLSENVLAIRNLYFDFDKFNIRSDAEGDLKAALKVMNQYPDAKVELSGHTDNKGSYEYNLALSLNRAKAAYNWLIANGISKSRIKYSNYSFSKPAAPNTNPDGSDNPQGRAKNRRVEFKIFNVGGETIESIE